MHCADFNCSCRSIIVRGGGTSISRHLICQQIQEVRWQPLLLVLPACCGLGFAPAIDAWNALIRLGAQTAISTVQSMSFFDELDPLVEGY